MSLETLLARAAAAIGVALTLFYVLLFFQDVRIARESLETRQALRRLAALTIRNFPGRDLDSPDLFWKSIGREGNPMRDAWGSEYRLSARAGKEQREYYWSSDGPDRVKGTRDDIVVEVPYPNGPGNLPDMAPGEPVVAPPISTDAK